MVRKTVENALLIYTDGSLYPGAKGGYGIVFVHVDDVGEETVVDTHHPPGIIGTTSPRMELQACIEGVKMAPSMACYSDVHEVIVRTDSMYVSENYKRALSTWSRAKWCNPDGEQIANVRLWKDFVRAWNKLHKRLEIEWVRGHAKGHEKDPYNVMADKLAKEAAKSPLSKRVHHSSVRKKTSKEFTRRGSVKLTGQQMEILVVEVKPKVLGLWKYRYQVVADDSVSDNVGRLDWIYSEELMGRHYYEVVVNDNTANPSVLEVLRELPKEEVESDESD